MSADALKIGAPDSTSGRLEFTSSPCAPVGVLLALWFPLSPKTYMHQVCKETGRWFLA